MLKLPRKLSGCLGAPLTRYISDSTVPLEKEIDFKPLNLRQVKGATVTKRTPRKTIVAPPRTEQMATDQDWGNVWPGPKSFHPASVPLPVRQGYAKKGETIPSKYANTELMKIPNFLHLTPPVIKRQCEALKKFCTPWPKALDTDEKCEKHFPIEVATSNYCHSSPSIRDPLSRIVTVKLRLSSLKLDDHAKDKFLRLVGDRYDEKTDIVTIVTDRCPVKKQNYEYAMYLITALYHESWNVEEWEKLKSEADMEFYDWNTSKSKKNVEKLFGKESKSIENIDPYSDALNDLMNDGENQYNLTKYRESVKKLLQVPDTL
ncbi:28S ribosomal protein S35, mitochondrial [Coccinella septempunctata]|uniref:28S ribosomal protein S35, mitochondrial n=1 Tax=Coccinella septempunctata TaxID=41139 RepID=UPI001D08278D|nr:28S ribosomal protein S35, mitochondrial [Coccinella septempunctata]